MGKDARPPADPKEAKLAEALRANLRRRKAAARPPPAHDPDEPSKSCALRAGWRTLDIARDQELAATRR